MKENKSQIIIYQTESGETKLDVRFQDETVWLTQKLMAELFKTTIPNINMHLTDIFKEGELDEISTIKDFLIVQKEGNSEYKKFKQIRQKAIKENDFERAIKKIENKIRK